MMRRRTDRTLSEDERVLWSLVARTAKPLADGVKRKLIKPKGDAPVEGRGGTPPSVDKPKPITTKATSMPAYQAAPAARKASAHLDDQTIEKLAKGRLPLEARVDLHGMRQDEAYSLLLSFVARAHASGARYVLVITGKGSSSGGDGVLKRTVPAWLRTAPFQPFVSTIDPAARGHGGGGALYLRLKRQRSAP